MVEHHGVGEAGLVQLDYIQGPFHQQGATALADRLYPMLRSLLSTAEPPQLSAQRWQLFEGRLAELLKERFNLRFQRATGQLENTSRLREARRDIARIKTIAAQKRAGKTK